MKRVFKSVLSIVIAFIMTFSVVPLAGVITAQATEIWQQPRGTIITYGSYPQSKVTDSSLISSLDTASSSYVWTSYGYYTGSGNWYDGQMKPSDYMKYKDFWYNGTKYRAVTFSKYRPYFTGYTSSSDSSYQDNNGFSPNNVYYFKYEPLRWRILDPAEGLVMCENIIDSQAYNNYILYANGEYWGDSAKTYYASNWAKCSLRQWLNDDFYNTAFSSTEKNAIKTSYLENKSTDIHSYDAPSTYDKIFLLSYWDIINSNYGFSTSTGDNTAREAQGSDYAKCQGLYVYRSSGSSYDGNSYWWLRSPNYSSNAGDVGIVGSVSIYCEAGSTYNGVRPALKIDFKTLFAKVRSVSIEDITINYKSSTTLNPQITADNGASYTVTYSSSNPYVVSVDQNGKVTSQKQSGFSRGSSTITVTVTDSNGNTVQDSCNVSVEFTWWQWLIKILLFGWIWY